MTNDSKINYIELPAADLDQAEKFYGETFGWTFVDYGEEYRAFNDGATHGGFYRAPLSSDASSGATLVVLYAEDLEATEARVSAHGGEIIKPIFSFPGGRRFHFKDPNGNELAIWSDN
jgi:predicted enzyme related to lactoylglutathione lyase